MLSLALMEQVVLQLLDDVSHWCLSSFLVGASAHTDQVSLVLEDLSQVKQPDVVLDQVDLLVKSALLALFSDCSESFTHDCDKHVHENNATKESSQEEHHPCADRVGASTVSIVSEFSETHEVC